jgi:phasin family protein
VFHRKLTKYFILLHFGHLRQRAHGFLVHRNIFALTATSLVPRIGVVAAHKFLRAAPTDATTMVNLAEQMSELNNAAVLSAARLSKLSLDSAERLLALQMGFAKTALGDATRTARAASATQDPQQLLALRTKAAETAMSQWLEYARGLYEVASDAQSELSKLAEERLADLQRSVTDTVDQAAKNAPAGSDVAVAAMKSSLAAATAAFDSFTKAARHAASFADASVKAATAPKGRK